MKEDVQNKIRAIRKSNGYSQTSLAEKLDVSRSTYSNFENGHYKNYSSVAQKFANHFGIDKDELLYDKEENQDTESYKEQLAKIEQNYADRIVKLQTENQELLEQNAKLQNTINTLIKTNDYLLCQLNKYSQIID